MRDREKYIRYDAVFKDSMKLDLYPAGGDEKFVALRTYNRKDGVQGRFLMFRDELKNWIMYDKEKKSYTERDCNGFVDIHYNGRKHQYGFEVFWMSMCDERFTGLKQGFTVPEDEFELVVFNNNRYRKLCYDDMDSHTTFDWSNAGRVLREIQKNPKVKRAFSKAVRNMRWQDTHFVMYPDFEPYSFGFNADGISGGLILSDYEGICRYGVHT